MSSKADDFEAAYAAAVEDAKASLKSGRDVLENMDAAWETGPPAVINSVLERLNEAHKMGSITKDDCHQAINEIMKRVEKYNPGHIKTVRVHCDNLLDGENPDDDVEDDEDSASERAFKVYQMLEDDQIEVCDSDQVRNLRSGVSTTEDIIDEMVDILEKSATKSSRKHEWKSLHDETTCAKTVAQQKEALLSLPSPSHVPFFKLIQETCNKVPRFMSHLIDPNNNEVHRKKIKELDLWATKHLDALREPKKQIQVRILSADW